MPGGWSGDSRFLRPTCGFATSTCNRRGQRSLQDTSPLSPFLFRPLSFPVSVFSVPVTSYQVVGNMEIHRGVHFIAHCQYQGPGEESALSTCFSECHSAWSSGRAPQCRPCFPRDFSPALPQPGLSQTFAEIQMGSLSGCYIVP